MQDEGETDWGAAAEGSDSWGGMLSVELGGTREDDRLFLKWDGVDTSR